MYNDIFHGLREHNVELWVFSSLIVQPYSISTGLPGTLLGPWSPSSGNVIFVPGFQPFLTVMVKIFSLILDV